MKKRILSLFLALVMCLSLLPTAAFAEGGIDTTGDGDTTDTYTDTTTAPTPVVQSRAATPMVTATGLEHTKPNHCICATEHSGETAICSGVSMTDWKSCYNSVTQKTELPTSAGHYYLTDDVTLNDTLVFTGATKNFYLCLNGHTITANGDFPAITVSGGATLYLTDCGGNGKVTYSGSAEGCTVKVTGGTFKLYNGTITHEVGTSGSGVKVESTGTFNLYNGSITGNSGTLRTNEDRTSGNCGGGVYIASGGTFNMYGGSITGNTAANGSYASGGGGVYIEPVEDPASGGTFNMYGGTISGNTAVDGGGVLLGDYGTFNMTGGEISGNTANEGGGVYVNGGQLNIMCDHVTFKMSGGSITGNNATANGGGVYGAGAYHSYGSGQTEPSGNAAEGNIFQISGTANVTGNTVGGTLNTTSKIYTGGTKNNMYVRTWIYSIHVADGFTGSFGVTVDEDDWVSKIENYGTALHGTYWKVVRYEGSGSSTKGGDTITYDNERFTFHQKGTVGAGTVTCNHLCGAKTVSGKNVCSICGSDSIEAEVTLADGSTKRCYESLPTAIGKAGDGGKVKLLKDVIIESSIGTSSYSLEPGTDNTVKLDLNGKACKIGTEDPITLASGTLDITGSSGSIHNVTVASGAKLIVSGTNPEITKLTVETGGAATLSGGKYGSITAPEGTACNDLLAAGKAFYFGDVIMGGSSNYLEGTDGSKITIKDHICDFKNSNHTCACGRECPHSNIDETTGKCIGCTMQMVAKVTKASSVSGETAYFANFKDAVESINAGDGNATIKLLAAASIDADLSIGKACTLDLNRKTLTIGDGKKLTVNSTVTIKGAAGTVDGEGSKIGGELVAEASADLTIEGDPTIGELSAAASAKVQLKGGTFETISIEDEETVSEKTIASLLASGYAFASAVSEDEEQRNRYDDLGASGSNVKVVQCQNHGVDETKGYKCLFCNTAFAVSVRVGNTPGDHPYYYQTLSDAVAYISNYDPADTTAQIDIKLLADVTEQEGSTNKTITFNRSDPLELDLNGKKLTADITVASGTSLTMSSATGTLAGTLTVENGGSATLFGGTFGKITVANGSVGSLLGENCGYYSKAADGKKTWLMSDDEELNGTSLANISVQQLPIKSVTVTPYMSNYSYGSTTTLTATVSGVEVGKTITYQWYKVEDSSTTAITDAANDSYTTPDTLAVGDHKYYCTATVDGYAMTSTQVTVTVTRATLSSAYHPTAKTGLTFKTQKTTGSNPEAVAQALVNAPAGLPDGCTAYYSLDKSTWVTSAENIKGTNAGTYTVYWYITGGANYNGVGSEDNPQSLTVTIEPKQLSPGIQMKRGNGFADNGDHPSQEYTGSPITPEIRVTDGNGYVIGTSEYTVTYSNNTKAGEATITVKDKEGGNFAITETSIKFNINRKDLKTLGTYTVYVKKDGNITVDLDEVAKALGMPANDGTLTFTSADSESGNYTSCTSPYAQNNITATTTKYFRALSDNHKSQFSLTIEVTEKTTPTIDVTDFTKVYNGAAVTVADVTQNATTGGVTGTWSWNAPEGGLKNVADSGKYLLTFTPSDDNYTSVTKAVQVTINAKDIGGDGITATAADYTYTGQPISPTLTVKHGETTLTRNTDYYYYAAGISATDAGSHTLQITGKGNYTGTRQVTWTIAPKTLTASGLTAQKEYDGTAAVNTNTTLSLTLSESLTLNTDYQITAVAFDSADAGTRTVTATVKLLNENYCFSVGTDGTPVREQEITGDGYITPIVLDTPPTVKADVVRIRQDVSVPDGSYPLADNVALTLPEGFSPSRELHFALGDLPAKVTAEIDEITGMLTYTISGGRSGEKFAIPVTLTIPNFMKQSGAAAVALFALNDQAQEVDPDAGTITLGFTVEIELTGGSHQHIRRQPISTTTGGGSGSTGGNGSASGSSVASPDTGDAGIALYGVLTVLSLTGGAWIRRKKR